MTPSQTRQARADRAGMIRRRLIAGSLALFVAMWLLIAIVLVSGHDPALAARKTATTSTATAPTATATTSTATPTTTTPTAQTASASTSPASSSVTTRQS